MKAHDPSTIEVAKPILSEVYDAVVLGRVRDVNRGRDGLFVVKDNGNDSGGDSTESPLFRIER
jgi:hypothetical protein